MSNGNKNSNGKVAVVTGSSRGIGKAIANQFVKNGYSVVLNARDEGDLKKLLKIYLKKQEIVKWSHTFQEIYQKKIFVYP